MPGINDAYTVKVPPLPKNMRAIVIAIIIVIAALIVSFSSFCIVPVGSSGIIVTFGQPSTGILPPGLHIKAPFISDAIIINNQVVKHETDISASSSDLQSITGKIAVNYHIEKRSSLTIYNEVGVTYDDTVVAPAIQESIKASTANYTAEELITKRQKVADVAKTMLSEKLKSYGIIIDAFNITNFEFSKEFNTAIEAKQTAQQSALKAEQDLRRIQVEAQQTVVQAQAKADAVKIEATAQAEANKKLADSITAQLVEYQKIIKWDGKNPTVVAGNGGGVIVNAGSATTTATAGK
jgi:prohibitin 2